MDERLVAPGLPKESIHDERGWPMKCQTCYSPPRTIIAQEKKRIERERENKGSNFNPKHLCILPCYNWSPYYFSFILDFVITTKSIGEGKANPGGDKWYLKTWLFYIPVAYGRWSNHLQAILLLVVVVCIQSRSDWMVMLISSKLVWWRKAILKLLWLIYFLPSLLSVIGRLSN